LFNITAYKYTTRFGDLVCIYPKKALVFWHYIIHDKNNDETIYIYVSQIDLVDYFNLDFTCNFLNVDYFDNYFQRDATEADAEASTFVKNFLKDMHFDDIPEEWGTDGYLFYT
jgi:hypothetical protein